MYWYKCWREARTIILLGIAAIAFACIFIIFNQQSLRANSSEPIAYAALIWKAIYDNFGCDLFLIVVMALGSGGLLQEEGNGTSGFTLSLPVSRRNMLFTRAFVGYCGVLAMALIPALLVPVCSRLIDEYYSATQALGFSLLWACCGSVFYAYTFLLAHLMKGEYSAMLVAVPSLMAYRFVMVICFAHFPLLNIFSVINGEDTPFLNASTYLLVGPIPWLAVFVMLFVASVFILLAVSRMESMDF